MGNKIEGKSNISTHKQIYYNLFSVETVSNIEDNFSNNKSFFKFEIFDTDNEFQNIIKLEIDYKSKSMKINENVVIKIEGQFNSDNICNALFDFIFKINDRFETLSFSFSLN